MRPIGAAVTMVRGCDFAFALGFTDADFALFAVVLLVARFVSFFLVAISNLLYRLSPVSILSKVKCCELTSSSMGSGVPVVAPVDECRDRLLAGLGIGQDEVVQDASIAMYLMVFGSTPRATASRRRSSLSTEMQ